MSSNAEFYDGPIQGPTPFPAVHGCVIRMGRLQRPGSYSCERSALLDHKRPQPDFLRKLRHPTRRGCFWIDAISINQADPEEKAQQIPLMPRVYGQAELVGAQVMINFEQAGSFRGLLNAILRATSAMREEESTNH